VSDELQEAIACLASTLWTTTAAASDLDDWVARAEATLVRPLSSAERGLVALARQSALDMEETMDRIRAVFHTREDRRDVTERARRLAAKLAPPA
jgi:hypothetical protein